MECGQNLTYVDNWREIGRPKQFHRLNSCGVRSQQPCDAYYSRVCVVAVECERVTDDVVGRKLGAVAECNELSAGVISEADR